MTHEAIGVPDFSALWHSRCHSSASFYFLASSTRTTSLLFPTTPQTAHTLSTQQHQPLSPSWHAPCIPTASGPRWSRFSFQARFHVFPQFHIMRHLRQPSHPCVVSLLTVSSRRSIFARNPPLISSPSRCSSRLAAQPRRYSSLSRLATHSKICARR